MDREWYQIFAELEKLTDDDFAAMTPGERVNWVWPMTVKHWWETKGVDVTKIKPRRDVARIIRRLDPNVLWPF